MMPITNDAGLLVDAAVLRRLGERFGVQTWPVVLDLGDVAENDGADTESVTTADSDSDSEADATIEALGLVEHGEPSAWAATVLRVLAQPWREIEIRSFSDGAVRRMCVARNGHQHVLAKRTGPGVDITVVDVGDVAELAGIVRAQFDAPGSDASTPADFTAFAAPSDEVVDRLGRCRTGIETTDALHALGATPADAAVVSAAFASCRTRTEIVASMSEDGRFAQSSGAVAVFDTERGRIVSSPSKSPDGRVWTTFSPGTGHRIAQAVSLLIETLPDGKWMP
ncbi:ESX secretion-associated protein EspG [Gordonia terrae]|uniref:ESX secretion-associated protein EspG n=1 Tax=Gordonia terrae TaxID=2055 RepID=A0A2I1R772_9ACTN|nr:ESX secretion-associated protein EspG [Gordonia terrae]PKZ64976.1 ESX secretion-associated protein EspG [Gordonia terrae]